MVTETSCSAVIGGKTLIPGLPKSLRGPFQRNLSMLGISALTLRVLCVTERHPEEISMSLSW